MDLREIEKKLGQNAKFGVSLYLLNEKSNLTLDDVYNRELMMLMASTKTSRN